MGSVSTAIVVTETAAGALVLVALVDHARASGWRPCR